jgi:DNA-directed RNA polymerase subunit RPC12/RpoP
MADLRRARNKVVHFAVPLPEPALRSQAAKVLTGLVDFIDEQLELKDGSADMEARRRILEALREFNVYLDERRADIAERVKALGTYVFSCPLCHEVAMTATQEDGLTCLFCKGDVALEEAVEWQAENELGYSAYEAAKEGQPFPAARCPRCEERTFMRIRDNSEQRVCFNCGARFAPKELESCVECGRFFVVTSEDDGVICDDCFEQKTAED